MRILLNVLISIAIITNGIVLINEFSLLRLGLIGWMASSMLWMNKFYELDK